MSYGTIKVDTITFTDNSVDKSVSLSGLIQNPTFTGNITVTGTISGDVIRGGTTVSGATVTGTTANFVSGVFTTQISGATVTGTTASFTSGVFTNISGTTATITSGIIASGTAAAPSLAILADLDTGLFSPGADQVAVATNGTGRLFIDASGNVGVGLTPASYAGYSVIGHGSTTGATLEQKVNGILVGSLTTDSQVTLKANTAIPIVFGTNNIERLRITSAGLVGIGTSSPSNTASFGQQLQLTGNLPCITIDNTGTGPNKYSLGVNGSAAFGIWDNTASAYRMYINSSGSIGIGTTGISAKLHVAAGASTVALQLDADTGSNTSIALSKNGSVKWYFGNDEANDGFRFYDNTAGTERLRITSAGLGGNVGIGTSSVNALLEVNSSTAGNEVQRIEGSYNASGSVTLTNWRRTGGAVSSAIKYNDATTSISLGTTTSHKFSLRTADTDAITIDTSQRVGIGTTSPLSPLVVSNGSNKNIEFQPGSTCYLLAYDRTASDYLDLDITAENLIFSTNNGTERARIDTSGRLGIGTSSPGGLLHVGSSGTGVIVDNTLYSESSPPTATDDAFIFRSNNDGTLNFSSRPASGGRAYRFWRGSNVSMLIDDSGRVGIGTTSPATVLDVASSNSGITLTNTGASNKQWRLGGSSAGSFVITETGVADRLTIDSSGRVGIGASAPGHILDVAGSTTTPIARIQSSSTGNNVLLSCQNLNGFAAGGGSRIRFGTLTQGVSAVEAGFDYDTASFQVTKNGSTLFTATSTGLGIGTTSPAAKLEVAGGNIRLDNNQGVEWGGVNNYIYGNESTDFIAIATNGNERSRWDSSGRLLVGTSSARANFYNSTNSARFQIEGSGSNDNYALSIVSNYAGGTSGAQVILAKSGGSSVGDNTLVLSGNTIGQINFQGADGTEFVEAASIKAEVDGTAGSNDMPGRLMFSTTADGASSPTERMRITSTGQVRLAGAGITFNGDTAAANELDDYEEGTWTPTLGGTATYSFQSATYTKVGRQVTVNCYLDVSAIGTGSTSIISGLPFTVGTFAPASGAVSRLTASAVNVTSLQVQLSGTTVTTVGMTVAGNMATQNVFGTGTAIFFTAVYFV
jgi:hypothetical protein